MPTKNPISFQEKMHALTSIDVMGRSLRQTSMVMGIPKSTLHDNLPAYRETLASAAEFDSQQYSKRSLTRDILLLSLEGKTSSRDCARIISLQKGIPISHQTVLTTLSQCASIARAKNQENIPLRAISNWQCPLAAPLSSIKSGAFDEIFHKKNPILGFVDPLSSYVFFDKANDRSEDSWAKFLLTLKAMGLDPDSAVTDGGTGMRGSIKRIFPKAIRVRDLFHVLVKLSKASNIIEGHCYRLIAKFDKLAAGKGYRKLELCEELKALKIELDEAISIFDRLDEQARLFRASCYFENDNRYVSSTELSAIVNSLIKIIDGAMAAGIRHRCVKDARTYFSNGKTDIVAYKACVERQVKNHFGSAYSDVMLGHICPIIEMLDQVQRSYENRVRMEHWAKKLAAARRSFRTYKPIDQGEVDRAIDSMAQKMTLIRKSNSLIEAVNSVVRRFLVTYKSIPSWFCPLFTFYWNHRRFARGKRKGLRPKEILTGEHLETDWIDELIGVQHFEDERGNGQSVSGSGSRAA